MTALELAGSAKNVDPLIWSAVEPTVMDAAWWSLVWVAALSALVALVALWAGMNYRTVTARRLGGPLAAAVLAAVPLQLVLTLLVRHGLTDDDAWVWPWVTVAAWAKWMVLVLVGLYAVGGLLSLLLGPRVIGVLRKADEGEPPPGSYTTTEHGFGIAISGGGVRAATISLGALQELEHDGGRGWDDADHVTSVSGGSYLAGGWSLARTLDTEGARPRPWASGYPTSGPEERHLRANLGYLLSNVPRGAGQDTIARGSDGQDSAKRARLPSTAATVFTGIVVNVAVFVGVLWILSQLLGLFYRWYFAMGCASWRDPVQLDFTSQGQRECLLAPDRALLPVGVWLAIGLGFVVVWVVASKAVEVIGDPTPRWWLLVPKLIGYGGLAIAAVLTLFLVILPAIVLAVWAPLDENPFLTNLTAVAGAVGAASATFRVLRKPLAKLAPVLGGLLFGLLLLFLLCQFAIMAMVVSPDDRDAVYWGLAVAGLVVVVVHFAGAIEWWSLAAFYRSRLRLAFATYRTTGADGHVVAKPYANNNRAVGDDRIEPSLSTLSQGGAAARGTPLTVCAAATVSGRQVRTHYGIPALSVTFSPREVRLFAPLDTLGQWQVFACDTHAMEALRPRLTPRLTTMLAVGLSGAAVSPAMGRFRVGPVSMMLAFFNIRLGMWIPNPRYVSDLTTLGRRLPRPGLGYLLKEFIGLHDPSDLYLYVTDGGHWENTALVELLRTSHHQEVVCIDADSGPGNLAKSISKAIDLAELECAASVAMNLDDLRAGRDPSPGHDYSPRSVNLGLIRRRDGGAERISVLWYCKPALTQDMPPQLLAYREVDPTFPRVSTLNQFFHLAQFVAYRDLGRFNARRIRLARAVLSQHVLDNATFTAYRAAAASAAASDAGADHEDALTLSQTEVPASWVLQELVNLIEHLSLDPPPDAAPQDYAQALYDEVRQVFAAAAAPERTPPG